ncbi:unnamed protein product [Cyclocybe aegerita]|uniref:Uncharacterized protein n=1 Tax=Cyclocybe aegerita TaxID=1973307 RepID=A0A8S0VY65_CYCAE|nr:unnamed protein product [Cyclocybe aegerita]
MPMRDLTAIIFEPDIKEWRYVNFSSHRVSNVELAKPTKSTSFRISSQRNSRSSSLQPVGDPHAFHLWGDVAQENPAPHTRHSLPPSTPPPTQPASRYLRLSCLYSYHFLVYQHLLSTLYFMSVLSTLDSSLVHDAWSVGAARRKTLRFKGTGTSR